MHGLPWLAYFTQHSIWGVCPCGSMISASSLFRVWVGHTLSISSAVEGHLGPDGSHGKESACNGGDLGSIPGSGRSSGAGNGNPLQDSCLGNPMDRGAWQATVHRVARSWTWLSDYHFHFHITQDTASCIVPSMDHGFQWFSQRSLLCFIEEHHKCILLRKTFSYCKEM